MTSPQKPPLATLSFQQCSSILEHKLIRTCAQTHSIDIVTRRSEKGFILRPLNRPDISTPANLVYSLRPLPTWRGVEMQVGIFLEGFAAIGYDAVLAWMKKNTKLDWYAWSIEGLDLCIFPRSKHAKQFSAPMLAQLEKLASQLERNDDATLAVYVEILVPYA